MVDAPAVFTVVIACPWCGAEFVRFTSTLPVTDIKVEARRCHGRRCASTGVPRVRVL